MSSYDALILGMVQGLTEFLPISSSGHLVLSQHALGLTGDMMVFDIFVHFGTLLAVLAVFHRSIVRIVVGTVTALTPVLRGNRPFGAAYRESGDLRIFTGLVVGTIPAAVVGLTLEETIETLFASPTLVLGALMVTGVILISTFFISRGEGHISTGSGLLVGLAQALAIVPGISRSGATISAALFFGVKREEAGEFSFLLSIPVIGGATVLAAGDYFGGEASFTSGLPHLIGMATSFASGWVALVILMRIIKRGKIGYFGFYCLAVAAAGMAWYFLY